MSTFLWLLHSEGLPLGDWLAKMDIEGSCKLCTTSPTETARHAFIDCTAVSQAWVQYNRLRQVHNLPQIHCTPGEILEGIAFTRTELTINCFSKSCRVTKEPPWDLLRCLLLRNIWCQRCAKVMREEPFHLGTTLHNA